MAESRWQWRRPDKGPNYRWTSAKEMVDYRWPQESKMNKCLCNPLLVNKNSDPHFFSFSTGMWWYCTFVWYPCGLRLLGWDGGVPGDQHGGHTTKSLDTQRKRRHVQQHNVLHISCQHTSLDGSTDCHNLIRVHALIGFLPANQLWSQILDCWDACGATDQDDFIDVARTKFCILHSALHWRPACNFPLQTSAANDGKHSNIFQISRVANDHGSAVKKYM